MPSSSGCPRCGAALALPADLTVTVVTCRYCGTQQPVPDLEERRRALEVQRLSEQELQHEAAAREQALKDARRIGRWTRWSMLPGLIAGGVGALVGLIAVVRALSTVPGSGGSVSDFVAGFGWDGKKTLVCTTGQVMKFVGISASLQGTAIVAKGHCVLNITGGTIKADTGIAASGDAAVTLTGVMIDAPIAIDASGNATVTILGGRANGKVQKSGRASVSGL